jgi:hypothetical protein
MPTRAANASGEATNDGFRVASNPTSTDLCLGLHGASSFQGTTVPVNGAQRQTDIRDSLALAMHRTATICSVFLLSISTGCSGHPCGDATASLPERLAELPFVNEGGRVCHVVDDDTVVSASVRYWGDDTRELGERYTTEWVAAGWESQTCAELKPDELEKLCFRSGNQFVELHLEHAKTPRLGSFMSTPSISVSAYWDQRGE